MTAISKKRFRMYRIAILIVVLLGIIFYPKLKLLFQADQGKKSGSSTANQNLRNKEQILLASGYIIEPVTMNELIKSTGTLIPDEEVELSFETSGKVVSIFFTEGSHVKKGELLAKINDKPLQAQLLKLQAQLKLSLDREFRQRQLLESDAISRESYDQTATELQSIEADIMLIEARISETELRAPFDGLVGLRMISEGAYATTQTRIVSLVKTSPLKVEFSIPERYAGKVSPGFPISFVIDGVQKTFQAKVYAVDPKVDQETRTIAVRALYPNRNEELKPGRFVSVGVLFSERDSAIAIPSEAVIPEMEGEKVYIYKNGITEEVKLTLGLRTESHVEVIKGLHFGDTLLTTAILQLRQNIPIRLDTLIRNSYQEKSLP